MNYHNDYKEFMAATNVEEVNIPEFYRDDLARWKRLTYKKLFFIMILSVLVTLLFCPQFGFGFFNSDAHWMHIISQNHLICGVFCATVLGFVTFLIYKIALSHYEQAFIASSGLRNALFCVCISYGLLMIITSILGTHNVDSLNYHLAWLVTFFGILVLIQQFYKRNHSYILFN